MKYDAENLLTDVKSILVNNLNTKIAAIEAEKVAAGAPATGLEPIDTTNGYFEQSWSDNILNMSPAIFYGIEEIQSPQSTGPATVTKYKLFVLVIVVDTRNDTLAKNKILRYSRAIQEVLQENYDRLPSASQIRIETIVPLSFKIDENTSEEMKVGGVSLYTTLM